MGRLWRAAHVRDGKPVAGHWVENPNVRQQVAQVSPTRVSAVSADLDPLATPDVGPAAAERWQRRYEEEPVPVILVDGDRHDHGCDVTVAQPRSKKPAKVFRPNRMKRQGSAQEAAARVAPSDAQVHVTSMSNYPNMAFATVHVARPGKPDVWLETVTYDHGDVEIAPSVLYDGVQVRPANTRERERWAEGAIDFGAADEAYRQTVG